MHEEAFLFSLNKKKLNYFAKNIKMKQILEFTCKIRRIRTKYGWLKSSNCN